MGKLCTVRDVDWAGKTALVRVDFNRADGLAEDVQHFLPLHGFTQEICSTRAHDGHTVRLIHTVYGQGYVLRAPEAEDGPTG